VYAYARVEVTRTKFFVVNGISIHSLWNIQLTFKQEGFRRNALDAEECKDYADV